MVKALSKNICNIGKSRRLKRRRRGVSKCEVYALSEDSSFVPMKIGGVVRRKGSEYKEHVIVKRTKKKLQRVERLFSSSNEPV